MALFEHHRRQHLIEEVKMAGERARGIELEQKVAIWARKRLKAATTTTRHLVTGHSVKRPYEVDVWAHFKGGLFKEDVDLWIECKDRKASIKRKDISDLVAKAKDVFLACYGRKQEFYFDRLMIVSTSRFDFDAIALANQEGIACVQFDGKSYIGQTAYDWQEEPKWLKDVEVARWA